MFSYSTTHYHFCICNTQKNKHKRLPCHSPAWLVRNARAKASEYSNVKGAPISTVESMPVNIGTISVSNWRLFSMNMIKFINWSIKKLLQTILWCWVSIDGSRIRSEKFNKRQKTSENRFTSLFRHSKVEWSDERGLTRTPRSFWSILLMDVDRFRSNCNRPEQSFATSSQSPRRWRLRRNRSADMDKEIGKSSTRAH